MKKQTKFILEIVVVIALLGYVANVVINNKKFKITGVSDFRQSEMNLEGVNQYVSANLKPNLISFPLGLISPDWKWVAYRNKDSYIEFASVENPSKILFDPNPQKVTNLISWSPDGRAFLASAVITSKWNMTNGFVDSIIIYKIENDESIEKIEFKISSVLPNGEPSNINLEKRIAWSPDGKFFASITNSDRHILIIDYEGNHLQTIPIKDEYASQVPTNPIREEKGNLNKIVDNLIWNTSGITFLYADSINSHYYKWTNFALAQPMQQVEMYTSKGLHRPTVLGFNDTYILTCSESSKDEFELLLINTETQQFENAYNIAAREIIKASSEFQNVPYTTFTSQDFVNKDILWIFDWNTLELKQSYIENYFAVTGWSPALDGIGVLTEKNRKFELWVVKP
jgi:hypothetical protein